MNCLNFNDDKLSAHLTALGYFELSEDGMRQFNKDVLNYILDNNVKGIENRKNNFDLKKDCIYDFPFEGIATRKTLSCDEINVPSKNCPNYELMKTLSENQDKKCLEEKCPFFKNHKVFRTKIGRERPVPNECYLDDPLIDNPRAEMLPWQEYYRFAPKDCCHSAPLRLPNRCAVSKRCQSAFPRLKCSIDARLKNPVTPCTNLFYVGFDSINAVRTLKHDAVSRYYQYKKLWDKQQEEYQAARRQLMWDVRTRMMHIDIPKAKPSQVPLSKKPMKKKKMKLFLRPSDCCQRKWKQWV